mgnify:CR=1 FL=1
MSSKIFNVQGIVQGVFFRKSTESFVNSNSLDVTGYVKNLPDGSVEVYVCGDLADIKKLEAFLNSNPGSSTVDKVISKDIKQESSYSTFSILRS